MTAEQYQEQRARRLEEKSRADAEKTAERIIRTVERLEREVHEFAALADRGKWQSGPTGWSLADESGEIIWQDKKDPRGRI